MMAGFGNSLRPDVGLISDGVRNLSEIYESDKEEALQNILLNKQTLDAIYETSDSISQEDLRSISGLSKTLLPSLHQANRSVVGNIAQSLFTTRSFYNPSYPLGGDGSSLVNYNNIILYNGFVKCEGIEYKTNTIGTSLFSNPVSSTVTLSTSRSSLLNSNDSSTNPGYISDAQYPGQIRVRRRSHVNRVFLPKTLFINKAPVLEQPSHTIQVNVDNGNTGTVTPVKLLASRNSPIQFYCRLSAGRINFTFTDSNAVYFYGYQVSSGQFVQRSQQTPSLTYSLLIETNLKKASDVYLYLYVNAEKVKSIEFSNIDLKEFPDGRDIGLIGFNNLESFKISGGGGVTLLPLWFKTLSNKLTTIDLTNSGNAWRSGLLRWFDVRNPNVSANSLLYTGVSYLTIPKAGPLVNQSGSYWRDDLFRKYAKNGDLTGTVAISAGTVTGTGTYFTKELSSGSTFTASGTTFTVVSVASDTSATVTPNNVTVSSGATANTPRVAGTDFRQFNKITTLNIEDKFLGENPRLDDVFPNLTTLNWGRNLAVSDYRDRYLFGTLPRIKNNGNLISYNIENSGAAGSITEIGTSTSPADSGYISKYRIVNFKVGGFFGLVNNVAGYIGNPAEDWSAWHENTIGIYTSYTNSNCKVNLQNSTWLNLTTFRSDEGGGATFTSTSSALNTPQLKTLSLFSSATTGQVFKLGSLGKALESINLGRCNSLTTVTENGINYILPNDFAVGDGYVVKFLSFYDLGIACRFRQNDLSYLYNLETLDLRYSKIFGKLPKIPLKSDPAINRKSIFVQVSYSNISDIRNLSINSNYFYFSKDVREISATNLNRDGGGSLIPQFEGVSGTTVTTIDISNSLPTTYRSDWVVTAKRGACVLDSDAVTAITGLSLSEVVQSNSEDNVYTLTGGTNLLQKIQVNDSVRLTETGPSVATVLSVGSTSVVISSGLTSVPSTIYFARKTIDISNWFEAGFLNLGRFGAANCRLSGSLNIRTPLTALKDGSLSALDLSNNVISSYVAGSLSKIFTGTARKITINLSYNALNLDSIRSVIDEVSTLDKMGIFTNCKVVLAYNKLDSDNKYVTFSQSDVFPVTTLAPQTVTTPVFRNEEFKIYQTTLIYDEFGNSTEQRTQIGTRLVQVPGVLVSGTYYKNKVDTVQQNLEDPLAIKYKALIGITVDLGFTYQSPNTTPVISNTSYTTSTTRNASIQEVINPDTGEPYDPNDLV
jgi:hypothetical protein